MDYEKRNVKTNDCNYVDEQNNYIVLKYYPFHYLFITQLTIIIYKDQVGEYYLNK